MKQKKYKALAVFVLCICVRLILPVIFWGESHALGDSMRAWERAMGNMQSVDYYRYFSAHMNYSLFLKIITNLFGCNYQIEILGNVIWNAVSAAVMFLFGDKILGERNAALPAVLYILNPTANVYIMMATPEHFAVMCFLLSVYLFCKAFSEYTGKKKSVWLLLSAGIFLGTGNAVKPFLPIAAIAGTITAVMNVICRRSDVLDEKAEEKRAVLRSLKKTAVVIAGLFLYVLAAHSVTGLITARTEEVYDVSLNSADAVPQYLTIGLNRPGEGQYHIGPMSGSYIEARMSGMSLDEAEKYVKHELLTDWKQYDGLEYVRFFIRKTIWAWQDDGIALTYFPYENEIVPDTVIEKGSMYILEHFWPAVTEEWYLLVMVCGILGIVFILKSKDYDNIYLLMGNIMIFGYVCLVLVSEAQSRYKCLVMPYICILAAYGITSLCSWLTILKGDKK